MVGREDKRTNNITMFLILKNNAAAGYQGPVKIELLKGVGLRKLIIFAVSEPSITFSHDLWYKEMAKTHLKAVLVIM